MLLFYVFDVSKIKSVRDASQQKYLDRVTKTRAKIEKECTIDSSGRAHAPYDGYELSGNLYKGGEYLPEDLHTTNRRGRESICFVSDADGFGPILMTGDSRDAVIEECKRQQADRDAEMGHVGKEGDRESLELVLAQTYIDEGIYGIQASHTFRTKDGRRVLYKGSRELCEKGETVTMVAKIKSHYTSAKGLDSTIIQRPTKIKVVSRLKAQCLYDGWEDQN